MAIWDNSCTFKDIQHQLANVYAPRVRKSWREPWLCNGSMKTVLLVHFKGGKLIADGNGICWTYADQQKTKTTAFRAVNRCRLLLLLTPILDTFSFPNIVIRAVPARCSAVQHRLYGFRSTITECHIGFYWGWRVFVSLNWHLRRVVIT